MGKKITGIAIGSAGITVATAEVYGPRVSLLDFWNDSADIQMNDPFAVKERVVAALSRAGVMRGAVSISFPDTVARVATLDFEELPAKRAEADELVAARAAKTFGIDANEYRIDSQVYDIGGGKKSLTAAVRANTVEPLEGALAAAGIKLNGIGLHSFNLANLLPAADEDGVLVARCREFVTVIVFRAGMPDFYRCKGIEEDGNGTALREVAASFAFYTGRNPGAGLGKIYLFDETDSLGSHIADIVKSETALIGRDLPGSGGVLPGVLPALGACLSHA